MDPRVVKQLLLSQWINNANSLDPSAQTEDGSVFGLLLNDLLGSSDSSDTGISEAASSVMTGGLPNLSYSSVLNGSALGALTADSGSSSAYDGLIAAAASKYGLDPALIKGVIQTESGFNAGAVSPAGAKGLMQLMDDTAKGLGVNDSFDPAQNIDGGARFLSYLLRKYDGNASSALAAYNAGPGRVDRLGLTTDEAIRDRLAELPEETQRYIGKVLAAARQWSRQG
uniref:Lytic transglycosylase domain-containing protein n=2 Tax=Cohnella candidum TaxID=2674991 RepID=A0A3G3K4N5_9BACL|nr:lytic transglycosylase domain-containing protein [Cohnella candidum]